MSEIQKKGKPKPVVSVFSSLAERRREILRASINDG
jgi:hypothetical protein